jgi:pimeloyl-ACP methyl ester carboxylesterase
LSDATPAVLSLSYLPGTLLTERSFAEVNNGLHAALGSTRTQILGDGETFDAELARLAASAPSPQVWVGHSLGGIFAINLAILHPQKCAAIVCIASTARGDLAANRSMRHALLQRARTTGSCEAVSLELKPVFGVVANSVIAKSLASQAASVGLRRFEHQTEYAMTRPERRGALAAINCPILALVGSNDDICPPTLSAEITALGAHSQRTRWACIEGAGHLAPMTHPREVAAHIRDFVASL